MTNPFVPLEKAAENMHEGVGSESLLQAAGSWGVVAHKLQTTADEMLLVIPRGDGQYWQGPAAQQMRDALTSVAQGLKHNAVVAGQIETAATGVAAAFDKARAATPTPQQVEVNRERRARLVAADGLGLFQWSIADLDIAYEIMWLHSIVAHDTYYCDTSHALERGEQTWWTPHQESVGASTTARDHPHPMPLDIASQITQHHDTAALCRIHALNHAIGTIKHQEIYEQHSTYAKTCKDLADRGNATAELHNKMAQLHREAAQLHHDLPLGQTDIPALAQKYVDIATTWHQTEQQAQETARAYQAASKTQPHLQEISDNLSGSVCADGITTRLFMVNDLDLVKPDLHSYTDKLQGISEQITRGTYDSQWEAGVHEARANQYAAAAAEIQSRALDQATEAGNAWRAARQHAQPIMDHAHDFFVFFQMAARVDNQATTLAGSSA